MRLDAKLTSLRGNMFAAHSAYDGAVIAWLRERRGGSPDTVVAAIDETLRAAGEYEAAIVALEARLSTLTQTEGVRTELSHTLNLWGTLRAEVDVLRRQSGVMKREAPE